MIQSAKVRLVLGTWQCPEQYVTSRAQLTHTDSTVTKAATRYRGNSGFCEVNSRYLYNILCTVYKTNVVLWITNNSWNINNRKMYFKIELCSINRSLTKVTSLFSCTWAFNVLSFCAFSIMLSLLPCNAKDKFKANTGGEGEAELVNQKLAPWGSAW